MDFGLARFLLLFSNVAIVLFAAMTLFGLIKRRVYAFGCWYDLANDRSGYVQAIIGYLIFLIVLVFFRFVIFPDRLFQYLQ